MDLDLLELGNALLKSFGLRLEVGNKKTTSVSHLAYTRKSLRLHLEGS